MTRRTLTILAAAIALVVVGAGVAWASVTQYDHGDTYKVGTNDGDRANLSTQYRERAAGGVTFEELDVYLGDCSQYESPRAQHVTRVTIRNQYGDLKWRDDDIDAGCRLHYYGLELAVGSARCADVYALTEPKVNNWPDPGAQTLHIEVCAGSKRPPNG